MRACTVCGLFPYLHNGSDEHGQHGQGKSEDVEKRDGSESFLSSQHVFWVHPYKYCKCGQRHLQKTTVWQKKICKELPWPRLFARVLHRTHQSRGTAEDKGGDRRQVGKLPHDRQFLLSYAFYLRLEGWLPRIQLQNLVGGEEGGEGVEGIVQDTEKEGWGNRTLCS